jgi:hypothetical protein
MAAAYNLIFGVWAGLFPQAFFNWFELAPPRYPSIWACLGMLVGLYGLLYGLVACQPEQGDLIAAVGLAGKILGPAGWMFALASGELPPRTFYLILANDLIWWFPFLHYLLRRSRWQRTVIAWVAAGAHLTACLGLLAIAGGTEINPEMTSRWRWVAERPTLWTSVWALWSVASIGLLAFCLTWAGGLLERWADRAWLTIGCAIVAIGVAFDLVGETVLIAVATRGGLSASEFALAARRYQLMSPGVANGLYCIGGLILSAISWRRGWLKGAAGIAGFAIWMIGLELTAATVFEQRRAMVASGAVVMLLFLPWAVVVGWRLRRHSPVSNPPAAVGN